MIGAVARKLFGSSNDRRIRTYRPRVDEINALEPEVAALSDEALRARTAERAKFDFFFLAEGLRMREHAGRLHELDGESAHTKTHASTNGTARNHTAQ